MKKPEVLTTVIGSIHFVSSRAVSFLINAWL